MSLIRFRSEIRTTSFPASLSIAQLFRDLPRVRCHHPGSRQRDTLSSLDYSYSLWNSLFFSLRVLPFIALSSRILHPYVNSIHSHAPLLFLLLLFTSRALKLIYLLLGQQPRRSRGFRRKFPLFTSRDTRSVGFLRQRPCGNSQRDSLLTRRFSTRERNARCVRAARATMLRGGTTGRNCFSQGQAAASGTQRGWAHHRRGHRTRCATVSGCVHTPRDTN